MNLLTTETTEILQVGNSLTSMTQAISDISNNPSGTDKAATIFSMAGVVTSVISQDHPFTKALSNGLGINLSSLGLVLNGIQINEAYNAYQVAANSGDSVAISVAQTNLYDKSLAFYAAIGATMAAIPVPAIREVGLGIWFTGTAAQQVMNGNAQKTFDIIGESIAQTLADLNGGPTLTVNTYATQTGEIATVSFTDQYGINHGEFGKTSGNAAVDLTDNIPTFITPTITITSNGPSVQSQIDSWNTDSISKTSAAAVHVSNDAYMNAWNTAYQGISTEAAQSGNTADYANAILASAGLGPKSLATYAPSDTAIAEYSKAANNIVDQPWVNYSDWADAEAYIFDFYTSENKLGPSMVHKDVFDFANNGGSPIVVDLNGDGLHTVDISVRHVRFDINGDDVSDQTAWLSGDDGFIAYDANGNGKVDGVNELFGSLERGGGYAELAALDENEDGRISVFDSKYALLSVWQDRNQDAITNPGEMTSLSAAKIESLSLSFLSQEVRDHKNLIGEISDVIIDGERRQVADVYFRFAPGRVKSMANEWVSPSSELLPDDRFATLATTI
jgi:hypothetical protein